MTFWLAAGVLTALVVAIVWPALRARDGGTALRDARVSVYRDRLRELDAELAAGTIDTARHAEARAEIEEAAATELADEEPVHRSRPGGTATAVAVMVVVPLVAFALYAQLGAREDVTAAAMPAPHDLNELVAQLAARMERTPDDVQGWMLLGRSRVVLGDLEGGVAAWREAHRLEPDDPTVLANLGEALVLSDPAALEGEAALLVERALAADPQNPKALWYGGLAAEARGEPDVARARWGVLLTQDPPDALRDAIERRLAALPPAA